MIESIIDNVITALLTGGGGLYIGFRFLNRKPNGSSGVIIDQMTPVNKEDCDKYKEKNSKEHSDIFKELKKVSNDTSTLLERTKNM